MAKKKKTKKVPKGYHRMPNGKLMKDSAMKKPIYAKARPKRLGKPKSFNKKSKAYKSAKRKADKKFGKKVSLYKNIFISQSIKKYKPRKKK